ncbi:AAA family ATPase [Microbacterium sp.]|uniref:AAA family ATPase n=1 Tax=Microbacterium sp. TaxID=51671 RepID=UPI003C74AD4E
MTLERPPDRAALAAVLQECADSGSNVLITGEPGVGKSRVLADLVEAAPGSVLIIADAVDRALVLHPFRELTPADAGVGDDGLRAVRGRMRRELRERRVGILAIDDVQNLDVQASGLVGEIAAEGTRIVATLGWRGVLPQPLVRLWAQEGGRRIELMPLLEHESVALVEGLLGGLVDAALARDLAAVSGGIPLVLRERVRRGLADGSIVQVRGVWRLSRHLTPTASIGALFSERLAALENEQREIVELVVLGEPLRLAMLHEIVGEPAARRAAKDLLVAVTGDEQPIVRLGPGIWRDSVIAGLSPLRRRRLWGELADAATRSESTGYERIRAAGWRFSRGDRMTEGELRDLVTEARHLAPDRVEGLLRAAVASGDAVQSRLDLAMHLIREDRLREAHRVLDELDRVLMDPGQRHRLVLLRARALAMSADGPTRAVQSLDADAREHAPTAPTLALRALALLRLGAVDDALRVAFSIATDPRSPADVALDAAVTGGYAAVWAADRPTLAVLRQRIVTLGTERAWELLDGPATVPLLDAASAHMRGCRVDEAEQCAAQGYRVALQRGDGGESHSVV